MSLMLIFRALHSEAPAIGDRGSRCLSFLLGRYSMLLSFQGPPGAQHYACHAIGNIAAQAPQWAARFATPAAAGALAALAAGGGPEAVRAEAASALARLARHHPAVLAQARSTRQGTCSGWRLMIWKSAVPDPELGNRVCYSFK